jgi:ribonuclease R
MLLANKTVALHIKKLTKKYKLKEDLPYLYRVHDMPNPDKLKSILDFILLMGHKGSAHSGTAKAINQLLAQFADRPEKPIVHQMLVRAMPKAEYSRDNIGHYGLGFSDYAHFTSPIRRYPDLVVHRLLKEYNSAKPDNSRISSLVEFMDYAGDRCTQTERNSMDAERASVKIASCLLASAHVGEVFEGTISGVTSFGLFVVADTLFAEGLLHIRDLVDDYYEFDEKNFRLVGKRSKRIYHFGGRIKVRIIRVNIEKRKIDIALASK